MRSGLDLRQCSEDDGGATTRKDTVQYRSADNGRAGGGAGGTLDDGAGRKRVGSRLEAGRSSGNAGGRGRWGPAGAEATGVLVVSRAGEEGLLGVGQAPAMVRVADGGDEGRLVVAVVILALGGQAVEGGLHLGARVDGREVPQVARHSGRAADLVARLAAIPAEGLEVGGQGPAGEDLRRYAEAEGAHVGVAVHGALGARAAARPAELERVVVLRSLLVCTLLLELIHRLASQLVVHWRDTA